MSEQLDLDTGETREWIDALGSVTEFEGAERPGFLVAELFTEARRIGVPVPYSANTPYLNTIVPSREPRYPGDLALERPIRSLIRWNAVATVLRANKVSSELGGHIASFQSAATLYDVGYEHFWHAPSGSHGGGPGSDTGPLLAGHLRAGVPRGPALRGTDARLPRRGRRSRSFLLPASVAHA